MIKNEDFINLMAKDLYKKLPKNYRIEIFCDDETQANVIGIHSGLLSFYVDDKEFIKIWTEIKPSVITKSITQEWRKNISYNEIFDEVITSVIHQNT